jgi:hypothetical protein
MGKTARNIPNRTALLMMGLLCAVLARKCDNEVISHKWGVSKMKVDTRALDVTGQSKWIDDGKRGVVLRAWAEGRLWATKSVMGMPAILDHAAGCPACTWNQFTVELCTPGLTLSGVLA